MKRIITAIGILSICFYWSNGKAQSSTNQFVLFDVTFDYTKEDADNSKPSASHYYVKDELNSERPTDWTSPVDFRNGTVHVRWEVLEKPSKAPTKWSLCYIPFKGQNNNYGCTSTTPYSEKGVYDIDVSMTSFWENESIIWSEGVRRMDLVIKDADGVKGHVKEDPENYFPTKIRFTMIQVAAGFVYDPSLVPNLPKVKKKKSL
ncbi:MAG: hypothetical protein O2887_08415 [Bacteroidetes bacterium]|nr:hypothetical protein [Bacteroidota bacterium]MDA1120501.1 hypothetical protein [Bacteroidota bacterium]